MFMFSWLLYVYCIFLQCMIDTADISVSFPSKKRLDRNKPPCKFQTMQIKINSVFVISLRSHLFYNRWAIKILHLQFFRVQDHVILGQKLWSQIVDLLVVLMIRMLDCHSLMDWFTWSFCMTVSKPFVETTFLELRLKFLHIDVC